MREVVFDCETTGLDFEKDRIIELGAIELVDLKPTGKSFHSYYDPQVPVHPEAFAVHKLSNSFLSGFKPLKKNMQPFLDFVGSSPLVAHNANGFDMRMVQNELVRQDRPRLTNEVVDTLELSKKLKPGGRHSLDTMARHFGVSLAKRVKHGAVVDCEILAAVYLHLRGGPQGKMALVAQQPDLVAGIEQPIYPARPAALPSLLGFEDEIAHLEFIRDIPGAIWLKYLDPSGDSSTS